MVIMSYPPLVQYATESEYRRHFEKIYCKGPITTFDGIHIRFQKSNFSHAFFESINAKDDLFSTKRAERIDWIKATLQDPLSDRYLGWDKKKKRHDDSRRVTLVMNNYVVVVALNKKRSGGRFITAFIADSGRTLRLIKNGPKWT